MFSFILIAVVLSLIILLILLFRYYENNLLKGFWCSSNDFCKESGLKTMILYIGENGRCSIVIKTINNTTMCETFKLSYMNFCLCSWIPDTRNYNASVIWDTEDHEDVLPDNFKITYLPIKGKLYLYDNDELLGELFKDNRV